MSISMVKKFYEMYENDTKGEESEVLFSSI